MARQSDPLTAWEEPGATALIVPIAEAEASLDHLRRAHTPSGRAGMPAHITLIAPFTHAGGLTTRRIEDLRGTVEGFRSFPVELARIERFPETSTLYLAPDPAEPFVELIRALAEQFPKHPPYGGDLARIVPHLTVASRVDESVLDRVADLLEGLLPIHGVAHEVRLAERGDDLRFTTHTTFDLHE